jgi:hypothetical protein
VTHAAEERGVGEFGTLTRVFDGGLADANGDDIAHHHHEGHLRRPGNRGGSNGQKRSDHADRDATLHPPLLEGIRLDLVRVIHRWEFP